MTFTGTLPLVPAKHFTGTSGKAENLPQVGLALEFVVCVFIVQTLQKSGADPYPTISISGNLSGWTAGILSSDICVRKRSGPPFALRQVWAPGSAGTMGLEQFIHSELYLFSSLVNFIPPA